MELTNILNTFVLMNLRDPTNTPWDLFKLVLLMGLISQLQALVQALLTFLRPRLKQLFRQIVNTGCQRDFVFVKAYTSSGRALVSGPTMVAKKLFWHLYSRKLFDRAEKTRSFPVEMNVTVPTPSGAPQTIDIPELRFPCTPTLIADDIYLHCTEEMISSKGEKSITSEKELMYHLYLHLSCRSHGDSHIEEFLKQNGDEYHKHPSYCVLKIMDLVNEHDSRGYSDVSLANSKLLYSTKTFDNLFFEQKREVLKLLDEFPTRAEEYKRLGIPNNLSFMFHGPPGTGKTSCIKAIANYLKRDIVMVRIGSFKKNETLINAMCDPRANVTDRKKMFVFEEIDCYCKEEDNPFLIRGETSRGEVSKASYNISHLNRSDMSVGELLSKIEVQDDKLSLSGILNALDGPRETFDRVIIFTTNRIERIDPAILRPGRTDLIVYFGALLKEDVNRYFKLWFHKAIPMRVYSQMKDHIYTQAQIGKMFLKYSKNPDGLYELFGENRSE